MLNFAKIQLKINTKSKKSRPFGFGVYLFNKIDTGQQVHTEINEGPVNTFLLVFFLFQDEHVMVEELLQFFVGEVDTDLFETVVL